MKYLVFCEDAASRKQIEELLSATSLPHEALGLEALLVKGRTDGYTAVVTEHETWQRNASVLRYFDCLDTLNQKPMLVFSKFKRQNGIKLRRTKAQTLHSPLPAQIKDVQPLLLQLG
jgi:hypothetical protein